MDIDILQGTVDRHWNEEVLPSLSGLVEIPAVSQSFDPEWAAHGHLDAAVRHVLAWIEAQAIPGLSAEVIRIEGRSPLLLVDVGATPDAADNGTALCYGHLDKQPPLEGWSSGLGPWTPVVRDGRLYGRGSADDGYAGYAVITALQAVHAAGGRHGRVVLLLETGEESGSPDLAWYLEHLKHRLGQVKLVLCLDSGGYDHDALWLTTSLRGLARLEVTVRVLNAPVHSGVAGGVVPCSFRILRHLLGRIEDSATGEFLLPELNAEVPPARLAEAQAMVAAAPANASAMFPFVAGMRPVSEDPLEAALGSTWQPALSVIGAAGLPDPVNAGNLHRAYTTVALSLRLPPTVEADTAYAALKRALSVDVPYGAEVTVEPGELATGWDSPPHAPWLVAALEKVGKTAFSAPWQGVGVGASIPFMGMLAEHFPDAQFVVTGAMDAHSRMHAPDESLHLGLASRVTAAVAVLLDAHARA
ncbi:M20/M25/M40 family metallo-hydrolase [Amycolatopsis jejuensis]|uniref:M20/M25/M40 family metallo-hydrolase n=1 Tax=Amycolatopsis jejuensis TaxID=330084 RepID=UPI000524F431|nr:M20/M25/M40 family metallo-hydrolase [Amycolatopsis jejuensis]